jgi:hypothetical protein
MDAYFLLAEAHAKSALHDVAFSARPDAPVLPYVAPRHRARRLAAWISGRSPRRLPGSNTAHSPRHARAPGRIVGWHE